MEKDCIQMAYDFAEKTDKVNKRMAIIVWVVLGVMLITLLWRDFLVYTTSYEVPQVTNTQTQEIKYDRGDKK